MCFYIDSSDSQQQKALKHSSGVRLKPVETGKQLFSPSLSPHTSTVEQPKEGLKALELWDQWPIHLFEQENRS